MKKKITSFEELYESSIDPDGIISIFITGHLMVEFMLVRIVEIHQPQLTKFAEDLTHYKLIKLVNGINLISNEQAEVLIKINAMRNKFAHNISYRPSVIELLEIFSMAQEHFNDMTDGLSQGIEELSGNSRIEDCDDYIYSELFIQISYDLHDIYQKLGGDYFSFEQSTDIR